MWIPGFVGHLDDADRLALDDHPEDTEVTFQHVYFLLKPVYHGIC